MLIKELNNKRITSEAGTLITKVTYFSSIDSIVYSLFRINKEANNKPVLLYSASYEPNENIQYLYFDLRKQTNKTANLNDYAAIKLAISNLESIIQEERNNNLYELVY